MKTRKEKLERVKETKRGENLILLSGGGEEKNGKRRVESQYTTCLMTRGRGGEGKWSFVNGGEVVLGSGGKREGEEKTRRGQKLRAGGVSEGTLVG